MPAARLTAADVGCWVVKSRTPPAGILPDWTPGSTRSLERCLRRSYRVELMEPGQRCLLWLSGASQPGVQALGRLTTTPHLHGDPERTSEVEVSIDLTLLEQHVPRSVLLADHQTAGAEVLRMPAGSNPSWLSAVQYAAVLALLGPVTSSAART